jgi:hypothetical protein
VRLIDRTRDVPSTIVFKRFTFEDPTERTAGVVTTEYARFIITAPPDKALWILSVTFTREMRVDGGTVESRLHFLDNPGDCLGITSSTTYVTVRTYTWVGFVVEPGGSLTVRILFRNNATPHTVYMRNVKVDILIAEVAV